MLKKALISGIIYLYEFKQAFCGYKLEEKTVKRLLAIIIAAIFVITTFASCAKIIDDEGASGSDSGLGSGNAIDSGVVDSDDNSNDVGDKDTGDKENNGDVNNSDKNDDANKDDDKTDDKTDDKPAEKPTFNVKESTSGLKFELNEDGLSYTVVSKGTSTAKSIVIDGHDGLPVTKVGYSAFADDKTITSVKLGDYVEEIGDQGFSMCSGLTSVTFGKNVRFLGDYSFRYCSALTSVELGKNIEVIKYGAFYKASKLATIKMYDKVRIIEEYAFDGTAYFTTSGNWKNKVLYIGTNLIKAKSDISGSYTVAANTTCIGGLSFNGCASITGITVPDSVHSIGLKAFQGATKLATVNLGKGITYIGEKAFENSKYYNTSANWKNNVLYVGTYLVAAKTALSGTCTVTTGTKVIADYALNGCAKVSNVIIPDTVVYIGEYAFRGCQKLSAVTIGSGVKEIGIYAFKDCPALNGITMKKTTGWSADKIEISSENISDKESAVVYIGMLYSDKIWKRA